MLKEPLLHFLVLAIGLFALHAAVSKDEERDARTIVVDRVALLEFIQYRTKQFDSETAATKLDSLSSDALDRIVQSFVREEALAREARALELDRTDYVIKRRLVQKLDYMAQGFTDAGADVTEAEARAYFRENAADFYVYPRITFTHVFFAANGRGMTGALRQAEETLAELRNRDARFEDAPGFGERFMFGTNHIDRTLEDVRSRFGDEMTAALFEDMLASGVWSGPLRSEHGAHLVLVTDRRPGRQPTFQEVAERVTREAQRSVNAERARQATQRIVDTYRVDLRHAHATETK
ncbi:peptidylprolyl isomerase [Leisingera sp. MMG026]|uniref:peptidylprolyl isomerase n=1 Tax=Leisingera sp. MMG026 TaxID=2909982 RepID=UPI001F23723C|nr:peptidylprolyl isomerase [Leisingera sp. MMG026]MCF6433351.1 peptidyl-prolyl cis-trans isomerase [Leisingera sp. MMG026]